MQNHIAIIENDPQTGGVAFGSGVGFGAVAFLAGWNWARIAYWMLALALVVIVFMEMPLRVSKFSLPLLLFGLMTAGPGAHWYFTGRDYRRRPGYKAYFDQQKNEERKRQFEY